MAYSKEIIEKIKRLYIGGMSVYEIEKKEKISHGTIQNWIKKLGWDKPELVTDQTAEELKKKIKLILATSKGGKLTEKQARTIEKLTKAVERIERTQKKELDAIKVEKQKQNFEKKEVKIEVIGDLRKKFFDLCYPYQREFWADRHFAKICLKSRQTGFSYTAAGEMIVNALEKKRDQILTSASQDQALIVKRYAAGWAQKLGINWLPDGEKCMILPGGFKLLFLPPNPFTIQGYSGDLYIDEWSWIRKGKLLYDVLVPSLTLGDRRIAGWSTPYSVDTYFGQVWMTKDEETPFRKYSVDIHRAKKEGLDVDIEKIRSLFDEETFSRLYECHFFTDELALLSFTEVQDAVDETSERLVDGWVNAGTDLGKYHDLTATALTEKTLDNTIWLRKIEVLDRLDWEEQAKRMLALHGIWRIKKHYIDRTGSGDWLAETMVKKLHEKVVPVYFTMATKEKMALNLQQIFQRRMMRIPNNRDLIAHLHAIKKTATETGFKYDSKRNEQIKHADMFWALALSCMAYDTRARIITSENFEVY